MTSWEEEVLTLLLIATRQPVAIPYKRLRGELHTQNKRVRLFWGMHSKSNELNRLSTLFYLVLLMQQLKAPDFMLRLVWPDFLNYLDGTWMLWHPYLNRQVRVLKAFKEFKQQHDLDRIDTGSALG